MKRWMLILLVLLMPLQYGWAAVGAYCVDEHSVAQLVADTHADGVVHTEADSQQQPCDLGCSHCHGHGLSLPLSMPALPALAGNAAGAAEPPLPGLQALKPRPERPQWARLA